MNRPLQVTTALDAIRRLPDENVVQVRAPIFDGQPWVASVRSNPALLTIYGHDRPQITALGSGRSLAVERCRNQIMTILEQASVSMPTCIGMLSLSVEQLNSIAAHWRESQPDLGGERVHRIYPRPQSRHDLPFDEGQMTHLYATQPESIYRAYAETDELFEHLCDMIDREGDVYRIVHTCVMAQLRDFTGDGSARQQGGEHDTIDMLAEQSLIRRIKDAIVDQARTCSLHLRLTQAREDVAALAVARRLVLCAKRGQPQHEHS